MNKKGYLYLGAAVLIFSTIEIVSKFVANDFNPLQLNFLRFFIGGLTLFPFALHEIKKKHIKMSIKDILLLVLLGIFAVPVSMSFFQVSILYTKASVVAVIISSNAIFVAPFSYLILKEKLDKSIIIGLILGIIGMVIIACPSSSMSARAFIGIIYGIIASITFALFSVLGKKMVAKFNGLIVNSIVFISGSFLMIPWFLIAGIPVFSGIKATNIVPVLYLGFMTTAAAYIFMFAGLSMLPANRGSLVFFIKPVLAGALAYLILKETFTLSLSIGTLFILTGIFITVFLKSNTKKAEKKPA